MGLVFQNLLAGAVLLATWMLVLNNPTFAQEPPILDIVYDVIIVGAGMSGLTTARTLLDRNPGLKVVILEGRDRIGGRISSLQTDWPTTAPRTAPFISVDTGASWIDSTIGNPLSTLVTEANATLVNTPIDDSLVQFRYTTRSPTPNELEQQDLGRAAFDQNLQTFRYVTTTEEGEEEDSITPLQSKYGIDWAVFPRGYATILPALGHGSLDIKYYTTVIAIDYSPSPDANVYVAVTNTDGGDGDGPITTSSYVGKKVVITVPLGVLKTGDITFIPPLPEDK
jgi:hypothetical protein